MNKFIFCGCFLMCGYAVAQTLPTQRLQYGEYTADVQPVAIGEHHANIDVKNPYGDENISVEFQEGENGQIKVVVRDKHTGKIISTTEGIENNYVDSIMEMNGIKRDVHLKSVGDDIAGTVSFSDKNKGEEIFANVLENGSGLLNQTKQGYRMSVNIRGKDSTTVTYTNAKTKEVVCILDDNNGQSKVYNSGKKLIAQGESEEENPSQIYDQAAWEKCEKVIDIFNDEDD